MKWIIKNAAPSDSRRQKWGDYHFGRSLSKYLERLGQEVDTHYDPGWDEDAACDVVLLLRGKYAFPPEPARHKGALRIIWNISHPADVSLEEYETYDLVFVASRSWADRLRPQISRPVFPLLQCTDPEEFFERPPNGAGRSDFVFVGNTRDVERPAVLWALDYGLPLKIWGRGWHAWPEAERQVVGDYVPNEELGALYSRSRGTLNDHWTDMKEFGFVNNRILDALACGLPVISDWHQELESIFPDQVLFYRDKDGFTDCLEALLLDYPRVQERVQAAGQAIRKEFSFKQRAQQLAELATTTRVRSTDRKGS